MSSELERLEKKASTTSITDPVDIYRILEHMLKMRFSYFQKEGKRYEYLRDDLAKGFCLDPDKMKDLLLEDILILIGYTPGQAYFQFPNENKSKISIGKSFNAAASSFAFALMIHNLENRCPTLKEFSLIRRDSFISSLVQKVRHEYDDNLPAQIAIGIKIGNFRTISFRYINEYMGIEKLEEELTIGEIMSCALNNSTKFWTPYITPYEDYQDRVIDSYELLVSLLMDAIREPLIHQNRERFQEIISEYRDKSRDDEDLSIEYGECYEHGGITQ